MQQVHAAGSYYYRLRRRTIHGYYLQVAECGISVILAAMRHHIMSEPVQEAGCISLANICYQHKTLHALIVMQVVYYLLIVIIPMRLLSHCAIYTSKFLHCLWLLCFIPLPISEALYSSFSCEQDNIFHFTNTTFFTQTKTGRYTTHSAVDEEPRQQRSGTTSGMRCIS